MRTDDGPGGVAAARTAIGCEGSPASWSASVTIAAVVVGGALLFGGRGTIAGTLWGTVFIGVLTNGLNLANVDP